MGLINTDPKGHVDDPDVEVLEDFPILHGDRNILIL